MIYRFTLIFSFMFKGKLYSKLKIHFMNFWIKVFNYKETRCYWLWSDNSFIWMKWIKILPSTFIIYCENLLWHLSAGLRAICLSEKAFVFLSCLKAIFPKHRIIDWLFFLKHNVISLSFVYIFIIYVASLSYYCSLEHNVSVFLWLLLSLFSLTDFQF